MRLIDMDALIERMATVYTDTDQRAHYTEIMRAIREQPTVDAVPVVRCCECKWHYPEYTGELMCTNCPKGQEETFFCAGGMRKDGQTG